MPTLSPAAERWLKAVHLLFVALWVGGGVALVLMVHLLRPETAVSGGEVVGLTRAMRFVDDWVIIPGAFGCLLTGLIYSLWTKWGFIRHGWVAAKWVVNVGGILFGSFFLGPWINSLGPIASAQGLLAVEDAVFRHNLAMNAIWGPVQVGTLIVAVLLSTLKPWKRWRARSGAR